MTEIGIFRLLNTNDFAQRTAITKAAILRYHAL